MTWTNMRGVDLAGFLAPCHTLATLLTGLVGCSPNGTVGADDWAAGGTSTVTVAAATSESESSATGTDSSSPSSTVGGATETTSVDGSATGTTTSGACQAGGDDGGTSQCTDKAPPDSFEAAVQWVFDAPDEPMSTITPLVANLTDDNLDEKIEPCGDGPDVILVATKDMNTPGHIYVLDGQTGTMHFKIDGPDDLIDPTITPAVGDIDGDDVVEIVAARRNGAGAIRLSAYEHDGVLKWVSPSPWVGGTYISAIALADLDNDGDVEIIAAADVYDHTGQLLWSAVNGYTDLISSNATAAADLDGDGDLEVVLGHAAYHHDGSEYYAVSGMTNGFPQIANLDEDAEPEILVTNRFGLTMLEHDGQVKYNNVTPTGVPGGGTSWIRPATVHDFDGNGVAEFATSSAANYTVYNGDASIVWSAPVRDATGIAAGTAFDFLGDGTAEAMYADEVNFFIFDENGVPYFAVERSSQTAIEYPTVADLDNDGSAEIAVVSMIGQGTGNPQSAPTVQVIRDKQDRWIRARRIWNQHTYHVTNVGEDGSIPQFEQPSWQALNTFRTQAQILGTGGTCRPDPEE